MIEAQASPAITTEEVDLVADEVGCMSTKAYKTLKLCPATEGCYRRAQVLTVLNNKDSISSMSNTIFEGSTVATNKTRFWLDKKYLDCIEITEALFVVAASTSPFAVGIVPHLNENEEALGVTRFRPSREENWIRLNLKLN